MFSNDGRGFGYFIGYTVAQMVLGFLALTITSCSRVNGSSVLMPVCGLVPKSWKNLFSTHSLLEQRIAAMKESIG